MVALEELRKRIDQIDDSIATLLNDRAELVLEVKKTKEKDSIDIYSPAREKEIITRVRKIAEQGSFPRLAMESIFSAIVGATRSLIGELVVGYLGPEGSYGYEVLKKQFAKNVRMSPEHSIHEIVAKVNDGEVHYGLLPLESSAKGIEFYNLQLLLAANVHVVAEVIYRPRFALITNQGELSSIKKIFVDPEAVIATRKWVKINMSEVEIVLVDSAAIALNKVQDIPSSAMICLSSFAEEHQQKILVNAIDDDLNQVMRYLVLGKTSPKPSKYDHSMILCLLKDRPGALKEILEPFAQRDITLTKIDSISYSHNQDLGKSMLFFIEVVGHTQTSEISQTIEDLKKLCVSVKVLGSFPSEEKDWSVGNLR